MLLSAMLSIGVADSAAGQQKSLAQQVIGTWSYVSVQDVQKDGNRLQPFGPSPSGVAVFEPNGQFVIVLTRPGLPKYASNNRLNGTAEENKATAQGSLAQFGTYIVNEADHSFTLHAVGSSYPNIVGTDRKFVVVSITEDEMKWSIPGATGGGSGDVVLKRGK